jgi:CheY-like chemotaxis protein
MNLPKLANLNEIVLVDDNDIEHLIIQNYYRQSGIKHTLLCFKAGSEFLSYMEGVATNKNPMPAIVLLDIQMPDIDGFEILEKIRKMEQFLTLPVILMLSGSDAPSDMAKAKSLGANGFQPKPVGLKDLDTFFKALLKAD